MHVARSHGDILLGGAKLRGEHQLLDAEPADRVPAAQHVYAAEPPVAGGRDHVHCVQVEPPELLDEPAVRLRVPLYVRVLNVVQCKYSIVQLGFCV